jgi:hypothetical protein
VAGEKVYRRGCGASQLIAPSEGPFMPHDVFVSYSSEDKPTADAICNVLENRGIRIWIAPRDVLPGTDWGAAIIDAINRSRVMILIYSASANESQQIKREVERAVNRGIPLIPFRIEDVPMSKTLEYFVSTPHWLDALTPPLQQHLDRLADTTRLILEQAGVELAEPPSRPNSGASYRVKPITSSKQLIQRIGRWAAAPAQSATLAQVFVAPTDRLGNIGLIAAGAVLLSLFAQFKLGPIWLQPLAVFIDRSEPGKPLRRHGDHSLHCPRSDRTARLRHRIKRLGQHRLPYALRSVRARAPDRTGCGRFRHGVARGAPLLGQARTYRRCSSIDRRLAHLPTRPIVVRTPRSFHEAASPD